MYFGGRVNVGFFLRNMTGKHDPWRKEISTVHCFFSTLTLSMFAVDLATIPVAAEKMPISSCPEDRMQKKRTFLDLIACVFHFTLILKDHMLNRNRTHAVRNKLTIYRPHKHIETRIFDLTQHCLHPKLASNKTDWNTIKRLKACKIRVQYR